MPLDGHKHLVSQGWSGKGSGLRNGAITKPITVVQKKTLGGIGKDRDEAFPFWDHVFQAAAVSIQVKIHNSDDESDAEGSDTPEVTLQRTKTGIISNRRPTAATPALSGATTPAESQPSISGSATPRLSIMAAAKQQAARRVLYSAFYRGPILSTEDVEKPIVDFSTGETVAGLSSSLSEMTDMNKEKTEEGKKGAKRKVSNEDEDKQDRKRRKREAKEQEKKERKEKKKHLKSKSKGKVQITEDSQYDEEGVDGDDEIVTDTKVAEAVRKAEKAEKKRLKEEKRARKEERRKRKAEKKAKVHESASESEEETEVVVMRTDGTKGISQETTATESEEVVQKGKKNRDSSDGDPSWKKKSKKKAKNS